MVKACLYVLFYVVLRITTKELYAYGTITACLLAILHANLTRNLQCCYSATLGNLVRVAPHRCLECNHATLHQTYSVARKQRSLMRIYRGLKTLGRGP